MAIVEELLQREEIFPLENSVATDFDARFVIYRSWSWRR